MVNKIDGILLFSGGLDSLLSALLLKKQGLNILCLHFFSPFFGKPDTSHWSSIYNLNIQPIDISADFIKMLVNWPEHGPGKTLNPCVDCKILMLKKAKELMQEMDIPFIATGEVVGQRPMSQRVETMNIIQKKTELAGKLLRPLCACFLPPTKVEENGLVNRHLLGSISGRGRTEQLNLAKAMGISEIPSPGGGCKLTEIENARRYWPLLKKYWNLDSPPEPYKMVNDFALTHLGRILFHANSNAWLCIGRNQQNNDQIQVLRQPGDILLRLPFPGPLGLLRNSNHNQQTMLQAASIVASYSPRARNINTPLIIQGYDGANRYDLTCMPGSFPEWSLPSWEDIHSSIKMERKKRMGI